MNAKSLREFDNWRRVLWLPGILLVYGALAILTTWPLARNLHTHLLGGSDDTLLHYWNCWWVRQALVSDVAPWHTPLLFFPRGVSLLTHNVPWLNALLYTMLEPGLGGYASYNVSLLVSLTLCGVSCWAMLSDLTGNRWAALVGGVIYQAWPYRLSQLGHPNLMATMFVPLFVLFMVRILTKSRGQRLWTDAAMAGVCFALTGYVRWQQLIGAVLIGIVLVLFNLRGVGADRGWKQRLGALCLAALVMFLLVLPPALLLLGQQFSSSAADLTRDSEPAHKQTDLLAFVTPAATHWALASATEPLYERYYETRSGGATPAYIGLTTFVLAAVGALALRRGSFVWLAMAVLLILLALGPVLLVNGRLYPGIPMPYRLGVNTPFLQLMREPDRFNVFLALPLSVLATFGAISLQGWLGERLIGRWPVIAAALSCLVLIGYASVPIPMRSVTEHSAFYDQLQGEAGTCSILNLPFDRLQAKRYMFAQTIHGCPIVQGNVSRFPADCYAYIDGNDWLRGLRAAGEMPPELPDISRQLDVLADEGIRYIVIHKSVVGRDRIAHWQRDLGFNPMFEDEELIVYRTSPQAWRDFGYDEMAPGMGPIETILSATRVRAGGAVELAVCWGSELALDTDYQITTLLDDGQGRTVRGSALRLMKDTPTGEWTGDWIGWGHYDIPIPQDLPAGDYGLTMLLSDSESGEIVGQHETGLIRVSEIDPALAALSDDAERTDAFFGGTMRLVGVSVERAPTRVDFMLHWQCVQRMERSYTVFVHIMDPETGQPVVQDDSRPRRGAYETTQWWPGEMIDDAFAIELGDTPAGVYGVALGIYDGETGERLELVLADGTRPPDRRLVLDSEVMVE